MSTVNLGSVVGPAGPSMFVPVSETETGIDKTYNELIACVSNNKIPYIFRGEEDGPLYKSYGLWIIGKVGNDGRGNYEVSFAHNGSSVFDFNSTDPDAPMVWVS